MKTLKTILASIATIFNYQPLTDQSRKILQQSDKEAHRSDWEQVSKDFKKLLTFEN